jgi:hypothetical protein
MAATDRDFSEIESFNLAELDVSGLDMRLELTTLMPHLVAPDCGPSFACSCYSHNVYNCTCHSNNTCNCHSYICECHSLCGING